MEMVSFEDLKAMLGLEQASIDDYPALLLIRDLVQPAFETFTGCEFDYKKRVETIYFSSRTRMVGLSGLPVKSVSSVVINGSAVTDYEITNFGIRLGQLVSTGSAVVTYKGGYATAPDWMRRAALLQTAYEFQNKDHVGADYVQTEGGSVGRPAISLLSEVKRLLITRRHPLNRLF